MVTDDPAGRDETRSLRRRVEVSPGRAALCARDPRVGVDLDPSHVGEVDHEPALTDAVSGWVVPASAHGDLEPCARAKSRAVATSRAPRQRAISAGLLSTSALKLTRAAS